MIPLRRMECHGGIGGRVVKVQNFIGNVKQRCGGGLERSNHRWIDRALRWAVYWQGSLLPAWHQGGQPLIRTLRRFECRSAQLGDCIGATSSHWDHLDSSFKWTSCGRKEWKLVWISTVIQQPTCPVCFTTMSVPGIHTRQEMIQNWTQEIIKLLCSLYPVWEKSL